MILYCAIILSNFHTIIDIVLIASQRTSIAPVAQLMMLMGISGAGSEQECFSAWEWLTFCPNGIVVVVLFPTEQNVNFRYAPRRYVLGACLRFMSSLICTPQQNVGAVSYILSRGGAACSDYSWSDACLASKKQ